VQIYETGNVLVIKWLLQLQVQHLRFPRGHKEQTVMIIAILVRVREDPAPSARTNTCMNRVLADLVS
jgi:hypothetical protein